MAWAEEDLIPLSALQHYAYCPRQCGLIHLEQTFEENIFTLRGRRAHERVDRPESETGGGQRVEYAVPLWSERLGLVGKADAIFFGPDGTPFPVEHKVGRLKHLDADAIQLCGQALCLEEMLGSRVPAGALYYHGSRRRRQVEMSDALRAQTESVIQLVRSMWDTLGLPPPVMDARCRHCSLIDACMPSVLARLQGGAHD